MSDAERTRLADTRRLIFQNLANGVRVEQVMAAFRMSEKEVRDHFAFVARKITEYRFQRAIPYLRCDSVAAAVENKRPFFATLQKCGPVYLTSDFRVMRLTIVGVEDKVATEKIDETQARQQGL